MNDRATRVRVCGPLAPYADGFRAVLAERGYAPSSAAGQLQMMAHLSRWLFDHGLDGHGLTPVVVAEFLEARRAAGYKQRLSARAMAPLLGYLREGGIAAVRAPAVANNPVEVLLAGYRIYLVEERGLAASTVRNYLDVARPFVSAQCASGRADLSGLTAAEVSEFVLAGCHSRRRLGHDLRCWNAGAAALPASGRDHADGVGGRGAVGGVLAGDIATQTDRPQ